MKKAICIILCIILCVSFTGCGKKAPEPDGQKTEVPAQKETTESFAEIAAEPSALAAPDYGKTDSAAQKAAAGANDFAFRFSAKLAEQAGNENFVCSPFSAWMPLAALVNATDEEHKPELMEALGAAGITEEDLNRAASRMLYELTREGGKELEYNPRIPIRLTNALFVSNQYTANGDFAQIFADHYRGSVMQVDFSSREAVDAVNEWASEHTDGLIDNIVSEFSPDTVSAIANAIYFSDRWEDEFEITDTKPDVFHSPNGDTMANYMRRNGTAMEYYEDDTLQAMPLAFTTGAKLYILLPKDGDAAGLISSLDSDYFNTIQNEMKLLPGKLLLPRFKIDGGVMTLDDTLDALGIPLMDPDAAPLTELVREQPLGISEAVQQATITVNEEGATAASVTVILTDGLGPLVEAEPFEMICNKPFVFVLTANTHDGGEQVLFTGMVNEPKG